MARAAKSNRVDNTSPPATDSPFIDWLFRPSMLFRVSLIAGLCALWPYALQRLPSLDKRPEYQITLRQIRVSPSPQGNVPDNLLDEVEKLTSLPREFSLLDEDLSFKLADAFRKHPWVSKVVKVERSFPATIQVQLEFRRAVAAIQVSASRIPIDNRAVVLPAKDFSTEDLAQLPLITNISSKPSSPGTEWVDPLVLSAAKLADTLGAKWKSLKLQSIAVVTTEYALESKDNIQFEFHAAGGSKILWGRGVNCDYPGELEPKLKISRLENYLAEFGDYARPNGPYEIDIRHWRENTRRPLTSDHTSAGPAKKQKDDTRWQHSEAKRKPRS